MGRGRRELQVRQAHPARLDRLAPPGQQDSTEKPGRPAPQVLLGLLVRRDLQALREQEQQVPQVRQGHLVLQGRQELAPLDQLVRAGQLGLQVLRAGAGRQVQQELQVKQDRQALRVLQVQVSQDPQARVDLRALQVRQDRRVLRVLPGQLELLVSTDLPAPPVQQDRLVLLDQQDLPGRLA